MDSHAAEKGNVRTALDGHCVYALVPEPAAVRSHGRVEDDAEDARKVAKVLDAVARHAGERPEEQVLRDDGADDGVALAGLRAEAEEDGPLDDEVGDAVRALGLGVEDGDEERGDPLGVETDADADAVEIRVAAGALGRHVGMYVVW